MPDAPSIKLSVDRAFPCRDCLRISWCLFGRQFQHGNSIQWRQALCPIARLMAIVGQSARAMAALTASAGTTAYVVAVNPLLCTRASEGTGLASNVLFPGRNPSIWRTH
jgi:hypothetical protein